VSVRTVAMRISAIASESCTRRSMSCCHESSQEPSRRVGSSMKSRPFSNAISSSGVSGVTTT
jgi:hypothetical protein